MQNDYRIISRDNYPKEWVAEIPWALSLFLATVTLFVLGEISLNTGLTFLFFVIPIAFWLSHNLSDFTISEKEIRLTKGKSYSRTFPLLSIRSVEVKQTRWEKIIGTAHVEMISDHPLSLSIVNRQIGRTTIERLSFKNATKLAELIRGRVQELQAS